MVVDEVHKTTRMLNDEGFALSQACKVSEMKGGVKFGGAACWNEWFSSIVKDVLKGTPIDICLERKWPQVLAPL